MRRIRFALAGLALCLGAHAQRLVIVDQDGSGPGASNQMAMLVLLQSPECRVLGLTMVSGNAWEPEEVQHTLRMLELTGHGDVPVVPGAVYPLVRDEHETMAAVAVEGGSPWYGAWGDSAKGNSMQPYHAAEVVPLLPEGMPRLKPLSEDAAHFLIRQVHAHPHAVTIYAAGPLTNIALAMRIDPEFAALTQGIVIMGGALQPVTDDPEFATHPRHEFNFWFDPEAAHIILRGHWPRIDLTTVDISVKTHFTPEMMHEIAASSSPAAQYVAKWTREYHYLWDELAALAWLDPKIITREREMYVDVDLGHGPNYGDTLTWPEKFRPTGLDVQKVHVQEELDSARFDREFVELMKRSPSVVARP